MPSHSLKEQPRPARPPEPVKSVEANGVIRLRRGRYASDSMLARRRRMLEAAKAMIAEGGPEGFTIRELGRRAGVSVTTIYANYGDKEGLLAAAIGDYYQQLPLAHAPQATNLKELLDATDRACEAILANKPYARQYADLYFSSTVDSRVYGAVRETASASAGHLPWVQQAMGRGDVVPGLELEEIKTMLANSRLMVMHDWVQGRVTDEELPAKSKRMFLIFARSITCGSTHAVVEAALRDLARGG